MADNLHEHGILRRAEHQAGLLDRRHDRAQRQADAGGIIPKLALPAACPWPPGALLSGTAGIDALLASPAGR